ncbi:unnamed protein product, partial [Thlaspi arvense]
MNDPQNPDLSNDSSTWRQLTAPDSDFFDRDTSNILSDFGWNLHASSDHPHELRFDSDLPQTPGGRPPVATATPESNLASSCSSSAVAVTEVSTSNNPSATSSSSEDPAENSTASAAKTPETPTPSSTSQRQHFFAATTPIYYSRCTCGIKKAYLVILYLKQCAILEFYVCLYNFR